jgi:hypothetical protein
MLLPFTNARKKGIIKGPTVDKQVIWWIWFKVYSQLWRNKCGSIWPLEPGVCWLSLPPPAGLCRINSPGVYNRRKIKRERNLVRSSCDTAPWITTINPSVIFPVPLRRWRWEGRVAWGVWTQKLKGLSEQISEGRSLGCILQDTAVTLS